MAATSPSRGRLRRLAELRPEQGRVLSVYFDLDPSEFATGGARATQVNAILDEAAKLVERADDLEHDELVALRKDVERIRQEFDPQTMAAGGVRGIAIFACEPAGLFEIIRVAHPVEATARIGESAYLEPLAVGSDRERWCVVLVSRSNGRVFCGDQDQLEEIESLESNVHGQHDQGGWSQARYQRSVEQDKRDHLDDLADRVFTIFRRRPFDRILVGGPEPVDKEFIGRLHPYLQERLAGRIETDVEVANSADVLAAAGPVFEDRRRRHEQELLERLGAGLGTDGGRAVAGLPDVLAALNEQRVEALLLEPNTSARGWWEPQTGYLSPDPGAAPTGGELQEVDDVVDLAIDRAIEQSAEVVSIREHDELSAHGGIAAVLRF